MPRSYDQFCALARSLDVVGERWTLLLLRELLFGPRRYGDLLEGLPGIGTNLLADRLRRLEAQGVVERVPMRAARRHAYALTERGRELEPVLLSLARWGMSPMEPPRPGETRRPRWYALALCAAFRPEEATNLSEQYEFRIEGEVFHLSVRDDRAEARDGPAPAPAVKLEAGVEALLALATRQVPTRKARTLKGVRVDGDLNALGRWQRAFALPRPATAEHAA